MFESDAYIKSAVVMFVCLEMFRSMTLGVDLPLPVYGLPGTIKRFIEAMIPRIYRTMATLFFFITLLMGWNILAEHRFEIENWRTYKETQSADQTYYELGIDKIPGETIKH